MMKFSLRKLDSAASETNDKSERHRNGFVIVEIIVAMVLLAIAVSSLAALMYNVSQAAIVATGNAYRNGVLMNEVNRLEGIPYDSIPVGDITYSVSTAPYPHSRLIRVKEPLANTLKTIMIVITPTNGKYKPDTVNFTRTKARTSKVLCTTCQ